MRTRFALLGLLVAALLGVVAWNVVQRLRPPGPVTIRCNRVITRPQIAGSMNAVLILAPDGSVWGWGDNSGGLFDPLKPGQRFGRPARQAVGSDWRTITAGFDYAVGIKIDGTLWGWSHHLQSAALPAAQSSQAPRSPTAATRGDPCQQLADGSNWVAVASGGVHALALRADGSLWAWGQNSRGQVGLGDAALKSKIDRPTRIGTNRNWMAIAASSFASLGLQSDGTLWHWGFVHAGYSQGPDLDLAEPTPVNESTSWVGISAADYCFIGRQRDGSVWVWGPNAASLGSSDRKEPYALPLEGGAVMAEGGNTHLLLLKGNGELWSVGNAQNGATGFDSQAVRGGLNRIGERQDWTAVWSSVSTSFGLTRDGTIWTWGTHLGRGGEESRLFRELSEWLRRLGLPIQPGGRRPPGTSHPWPLAAVVTNRSSASR